MIQGGDQKFVFDDNRFSGKRLKDEFCFRILALGSTDICPSTLGNPFQRESMGTCRRRIFIVDDDLSFGRSLKRLLNARGILADFFDSAVHFMDSVPSGQHGIAIVDIHMPECDGFALMEKMQDLNYRMPVVLITGRTEGFTRDMALQRGASGFLKKPFREQSLMSLIEALEQEGDASH